MQQRKMFVAVLSAGLIFAGAAIAQPSEVSTSTIQSTHEAPLLVQGLPDFTPLVEAASPTVVNIRTMKQVYGRRAGSYMNPDMPEFFDFFFYSPVPGSRLPSPLHPQQIDPDDYVMRPSGVGSGFIIAADGYIMTNAHVVDGADELIVTLPNEKEYSAKVVGADKRTDVAVIKIDGVSDLPTVRIGSPEKLKVGEWVVAIGSPFGLENTVTAGIVSAKQRDTGDYVNFIQSDVAVNPGNSGGPLINMRGEVVGINSQIYSRSGGFMGISFSIPIDEAMTIAQKLREHGYVQRGRIGVVISPTSKEVAQAIGLGDQALGATVSAVDEAGPAVKAGIQPGDIITEVNGTRIDRFSDVSRIISNIKPGDQAQIKVFREGDWKTVTVTVDAVSMNEEQITGKTQKKTPETASQSSRLGFSIADLTDAQKQALKIDRGVVVSAINKVSVASMLREGDIILQVGNTKVENINQFNELIEKAPADRDIAFLVKQRDGVRFVLLKPSR